MKKLIFICFLLLSTYTVFAQNYGKQDVHGTVVDLRGEPLIGVSVKEKDGKAMAITDFDGNYTISVTLSDKAALVVSYIGYKSEEVKVDGKKEIHVVLKDDAQLLDEMVVIGYGTQKRSSLTSSIETIKAEDILKMPVTSIDQALVGQIAGLSVMSSSGDPSGKEAELSIRGIFGKPLLVIDGVPRFGENTGDTETRLSDLNPDDIESISVLKDAAAAAIYGARSARGVVLVTTKRGKNHQKVKINYRGQYNLQKATKFPKFLDAYEFAKLYNQALDSSPDYNGTFSPFTSDDLDAIRTNSSPNKFGNENLLDYLNDTGHSTTHSLSISGGTQDVRYYLSGAYTSTQGLYSGVGRDRYNYSLKVDANLTKDLSMSIDAMGTRSDNKNTSYSTLDAAYNFAPTEVLQFTDGRLASLTGANPLISVRGLGGYRKYKTSLNSLSLKLNYEIPLIKGLSAYIRATFDDNNTRSKIFSTPVTLYKVNKTTQEIEEDANTVYPTAKITLQEISGNVDNKVFDIAMNYSNTFASKHNVTGFLLANYQRTDFWSQDVKSNNAPGSYPEIIGTGVSEASINGSETRAVRQSIAGRATYNYDYRYFLETSFRYDGSTKFHPDNRWKFFPSLSVSWVASNEEFFKNWKQDVISNLKIRGSIGVLGTDADIANFSYQSRYSFISSSGYSFGGGNIRPGVIPAIDELPNIDIQMEKREDYNIATDLGFWDNRFGVTYEYYWRYNTDYLRQMEPYEYPPSAGAGGRVPYINGGKLKSWGWDLTINHRNTIGSFKYNADFTISKTDDKILDWGDESSLPEYRRRKGKSFLTWRLYEADGLFKSIEEIQNLAYDQDGQGNITLAPGDIKYKNQNGDGVIDSNDMIYVNNSSYPDLTFSMKLGVEYKGFFVNAMFQGVSGYSQQINELYSLYSNSLPRFQTYHRDNSWTEDNPNAKYPRVMFASTNGNNRKASTFWIQECDFVRLRSLNIGYNVPSRYLQKMKISSLNISLNGGNLFTWSTLKDIDPESVRSYPIQRTYGASINIGF